MTDVLIHGDSVRSPELRHEVPLAVGDRFLYLEAAGVRHVVLSQMELVRLDPVEGLHTHTLEELRFDEILARASSRGEAELELVLHACRHFGLTSAAVPSGFPLGTADHLRAHGIVLRADDELFAARRRVKSGAELAGIRRAQRAGEAAMEVVRTLLREARIDDGALVLRGKPLTCERIKLEAEAALARHGAQTDELIVSHGPQSAVGHDEGSGPILAGETVIADIFPRDRASGCFADMTRTFVRGPVSDEVRRWHALCSEALQIALGAIRPGVTGRELFAETCELFEQHGFPTQRTKAAGVPLEDGFYHSLGHGVGLEVHEPPYLGRSGAQPLVAGDVVAVEPGLYRKGHGGCRIEDLVLVTPDGCENLTDFPYDLEP